jgi:hypothetical protein
LALARSSSQQIFRAMGISSFFGTGAKSDPRVEQNIIIPGQKARECQGAWARPPERYLAGEVGFYTFI